MFAIYTPDGRYFSGPLERLRRVEKSVKTNAGRRLSDTEKEITEQHKTVDYHISEKAVAQYRSLLTKEHHRGPVYHAYQVMSKTVQFLNSNWLLSRAIEQFRRYSYQVFPVINDQRGVGGSVSRQQFYAFLLARDKPINKDTRTIQQCFIKADSRVYVADPVTDVRRIASLLVEKKLDAMPVVEDTERIVGIISRTDILRCAVSDPPLSLWC